LLLLQRLVLDLVQGRRRRRGDLGSEPGSAGRVQQRGGRLVGGDGGLGLALAGLAGGGGFGGGGGGALALLALGGDLGGEGLLLLLALGLVFLAAVDA